MTYWDRRLILEQMDSKLLPLKQLLNVVRPEKGWIKTLREALGMSSYELAKRSGLTQPRISNIESAEVDGDLKISTLKKMAESMGLVFVYGFVPPESLSALVEEQAQKVALEKINKVNHTMVLENQQVSTDERKKVLNDLIEKTLHNPPKDFWLK
jgi:predicted DNA-binding mobile mystery protein A